MRPTRYRIAFAVALLGVLVSAVALVVHQRLAAGAGYTSFCNLGGAFNCDLVLGSRYGTWLGVPVAAWAVAAFAVGVALAIPGAFLGRYGTLADVLLVGMVSGSLGTGLVLALVMAFVLRHVCLLCLATDAVIILWGATVIPLVGQLPPSLRRSAAWIGAAGALATIGGVSVAAIRTPNTFTDVAQIRVHEPKFYGWYTGLKSRPFADLVGPASHSRGRMDAPVVILEFSDFECPFCAKASHALQDVLRDNLDVRLVFRHFPLDSTCNGNLRTPMHQDACLAALAAECAANQDQFWEYHDLLFDNQEQLDRTSLVGHAKALGLDVDAFYRCLDDSVVRTRVASDVDAAGTIGITSTPTMLINGRLVEGALDRRQLEDALTIERDALQRKPERSEQ